MYKLVKHKWLYYLLHFTWALPINLIMFIIIIILRLAGHPIKRFGNMWYVVIGRYWGGLSVGTFFLIDKYELPYTMLHESGHGIQTALWGILTPFVVYIPSALRYWYRELRYKLKRVIPKTKYDDIWFEGQASNWGRSAYEYLIKK